MNILPKYWFT